MERPKDEIKEDLSKEDQEAIVVLDKLKSLFSGVELKSYSDYPQAAKNNAKRALKWVEENGWGSCGEATGKKRANQLAKGEPISRDTIARMASFIIFLFHLM